MFVYTASESFVSHFTTKIHSTVYCLFDKQNDLHIFSPRICFEDDDTFDACILLLKVTQENLRSIILFFIVKGIFKLKININKNLVAGMDTSYL